jgi:hypothetical protein
VIVRPATREDIEAFSDMPDKPTLRAWAGEIDGRIVALGGFAFSGGRWFAFCDLTEEARKHKFTIARTAHMVLSEARKQGIKFIYAEADPEEPGAVRWMASLGFTIDPRTVYLYRWRA